jgi:hypothetical protein
MRERPAFQPTDEQRKNVEVMVGLGIPEENICLLVRDRRDKPISRNSLRKHFKKQLETGATKLNAQVGNFMVSTIFGAKPPNGTTPIRDERVRSNPFPSSGESTNLQFLPDFILLLPRSTSYSPPTIKVHSPSGYVTPKSFFANVRLLTLHRDAAHHSLELSKEYDEWIGA